MLEYLVLHGFTDWLALFGLLSSFVMRDAVSIPFILLISYSPLALSINPPITLGIDASILLHLWRYDSRDAVDDTSSCRWCFFYRLILSFSTNTTFLPSNDVASSFSWSYSWHFDPNSFALVVVDVDVYTLLVLWFLLPWQYKKASRFCRSWYWSYAVPLLRPTSFSRILYSIRPRWATHCSY